MALKENKKQILILSIVTIAFAGYFYYTRPAPNESFLIVTEKTRGVSSQELVPILGELRRVRVDGAIFKDPAYQNLVDYTLPLGSEPKSRPDPLAPIGSEFGP